jgi:hypothetical protein
MAVDDFIRSANKNRAPSSSYLLFPIYTPVFWLAVYSACHLLTCWFLLKFSTLKMEAICSSETSVASQQTTRRHIPEDDTLHNHRCESLKSYGTTFQCIAGKVASVINYCSKENLSTREISPSCLDSQDCYNFLS